MVKQQCNARKTLKLSTALIFVGLLLCSCGGKNQNETNAQPAPDVDFIELKEAGASTVETYPGTIEGTVNVDIRAQVSGYLDQIYVKEGDYVNKGQLLFKIKGDVFNEQINSSKATYEAALAAKENAKIELEKIKPLVQGEVVSEMQLKTAQSQYQAASAQAAQAKSALSTSQLNAAFALIKAPVSGYIGRIPSRIGNLVTPTDSNPLTTLSEIDKVFVYFTLNESEFTSFMKARAAGKGGNTVDIIMADGSKYSRSGKVEVASGNVDSNTGTVALKAVFDNPEKLLRSGGAARIVLTKAVNNALTVPMAAVKDIQDRFFVYVLTQDNKLAMKPIEIEGRSGASYIVKSGLKSGEKIAVNRIDQLAEGLSVTPAVVTGQAINKK